MQIFIHTHTVRHSLQGTNRTSLFVQEQASFVAGADSLSLSALDPRPLMAQGLADVARTLKPEYVLDQPSIVARILTRRERHTLLKAGRGSWPVCALKQN